ncbi:hypothetical protein [Shewanella xiamenensis]|uniref:hypothetical protein n=1 Tax=Shewanella xiamenensis TaxID=332186 RepID=UPI00313C4A97
MASMSRSERAAHYFKRLMSARNVRAELDDIFNEIESLVYTSNNQPLTKQEKILIIEELESLVRKSPYNISESAGLEQFRNKTSASDNSDILDVISAMKKKIDK